jgi:hypothetical protein
MFIPNTGAMIARGTAMVDSDRDRRPSDGPSAPTFTEFFHRDPKVVLSLLVGTVAVCGLLNHIIFYRVFGIAYEAHLGVTDFLSIAIQVVPFMLSAIVALLIVAAAALGLGVLASALLPTLVWLVEATLLLTATRLPERALRAPCRRLGQLLDHAGPRLRRFGGAVGLKRQKARLHHLQEEPHVCLTEQLDRVTQRWRHRRRGAWGVARWCLSGANRRYLEIFFGAALIVASLGLFTSWYAAERLHGQLTAEPASEPMPGWVDRFLSIFFPAFLGQVSLNLADLDGSLEGSKFLGGTSRHAFVFSRELQAPLILPVERIELIGVGPGLHEMVRKDRAPAVEPAPDDELVAGVAALAEAVAAVGASLERLTEPRYVMEPVVHDEPQPGAGGFGDCRDHRISGVGFRFEHGDDRVLDGEWDGDNRIAHARLIDHLTGTAAYRPGDYLLVVGHADSSGPHTLNGDLAKRRARAVVGLLASDPAWRELGLFPGWTSFEQLLGSLVAIGAGEGVDPWVVNPASAENRVALVYHCPAHPAVMPAGDDATAALSEHQAQG